jgi:hypothetical protein
MDNLMSHRQFRLHNRSDEEMRRLQAKAERVIRRGRPRAAALWAGRLVWALAGALAALLEASPRLY